jgi:hypothetical protein
MPAGEKLDNKTDKNSQQLDHGALMLILISEDK